MNVRMEDEMECHFGHALEQPRQPQATTIQSTPPPALPTTMTLRPKTASEPTAPLAIPLFLQLRYGVTPNPHNPNSFTVQVNHYNFQPFYRWLSTTSAPSKATKFTFSMQAPRQTESYDLTPTNLAKKLKQGLYYLFLASLHYPYVLNAETKVVWHSIPKTPNPKERGVRNCTKLNRCMKRNLDKVLEGCINCTREAPVHAYQHFTEQKLKGLYRHWADQCLQLYAGELCTEGALVVRRCQDDVGRRQKPRVSTRGGGLRFGFVHRQLGGSVLCAVAPSGQSLFPPKRRDSAVKLIRPTALPTLGNDADRVPMVVDEESFRQFLSYVTDSASFSYSKTQEM